MLRKEYIDYLSCERPVPASKQTIATHKKRLDWLWRRWGGRDVETITLTDILDIKCDMLSRGCKLSYIQTFLCLIRAFFRYCKENKKLDVLDPSEIKLPSVARENVEYLNQDELRRFVQAINLSTTHGVRFMAFVALLLDTGMRINEALALDRDQVPWKTKRLWIVGKGSKKRLVFFRDWSLSWIKKYLELRKDNHPALFVIDKPPLPTKRIVDEDMRRFFRLYGKRAGLKRVWPHMLRRTAATHLRTNGEDTHVIQRFLGHSRIGVTEKYLGVDWDKIQISISNHMGYGDIEKEVQVFIPDWACVGCTRTDRKHAGKGFCTACYVSRWRLTKRLTHVKCSDQNSNPEDHARQTRYRTLEESRTTRQPLQKDSLLKMR